MDFVLVVAGTEITHTSLKQLHVLSEGDNVQASDYEMLT